MQNLKSHRQLQEAFAFALGDTLRFACQYVDDKDAVAESWDVKVDHYNSLYIESTANAWVSVLKTESVVYLTGFRGNHRSALYYFYLAAAQVPLGYLPGLTWGDRLPLGKVLRSWVRPLSELFLLFGTPLRADVHLHFGEGADSGTVIESDLRVSGRGPFRAVRQSGGGRLRISPDGEIATLDYFQNGRRVFHARRLSDDEFPATATAPVLEETQP